MLVVSLETRPSHAWIVLMAGGAAKKARKRSLNRSGSLPPSKGSLNLAAFLSRRNGAAVKRRSSINQQTRRRRLPLFPRYRRPHPQMLCR
jgi:hypothetical protein